ncbi:Rossmann-fold NAD(P)-binding domain-containing protein [Cupriavidus yeoncheonensis]|uniref:hypothetical protein n=1 Tax=Cupriavidus yeoncheonensis TaxID=1462994 RepID=UPI001BA6583C
MAAHTASKTATGFTASLVHELGEFGVHAKLVEPGYCPDTRFAENSGSRMAGMIPEAYGAYAQSVLAGFTQPAHVTKATDVAEAVWKAANDVSGQVRFPAGADAVALFR